MKKLNQQGFAVTTIILIVVVLGLVGGIGYYLTTQNSSENERLQQTDSSNTDQQETIDNQNQEKLNEQEQTATVPFEGTEVNCNDQFTFSIPEGGWYFGNTETLYYDNIESGGNCYVATQKQLPPHGYYTGENISFIFSTSKQSLSLSEWVTKYFNDHKDGEFGITKTSQQSVKLYNGNEAILATAQGGHSVNGGDKNMYFFYKKGSLGITTSWDISTTDQKLRDRAEEIVKTID
ncbi:hypothetical protein BH23PAT2_BH23PAT2_05740 [soil metagenome]